VNRIKRFFLFLILATAYVVPASAQTSQTGRIEVGLAAARPSSCVTAGDTYIAADTPSMYVCGPAGTWNTIPYSNLNNSFSGTQTINNLTITGTCSGAACGIGTGTDNILANNNRFQGPIPFVDVTSFMPAGGCSEASGNEGTQNAITATIAVPASPTTVAVSGGFITRFFTGCGVAIEGAGATSVLSAPGSLTATSHVAGGSTTFNYQVVACDNNEGCSAASSNFAFTTSDAWANLTDYHYNFVSWAAVSNAVLYCVYSDEGLGGALVPIGCSPTTGYMDKGYTTPIPTFLPSTPPVAATAQTLFTTISAGGGTSSWTIANAATTAVTGTKALHDISTFVATAINGNIQGGPILGSYVDKNAYLLIPAGAYTLVHTPSVMSGTKVVQLGIVYSANLPINMNNAEWDGSLSGSAIGSFALSFTSSMVGSTTAPVMVLADNTHIKNINMSANSGIGIYEFGGSTWIDNSQVTNVTTNNSCPVLAESAIVFTVSHSTFIAGTGSNASGSFCFDDLTTGLFGSSVVEFENNYFLERGVKIDNPVGISFATINGIRMWHNYTENNIDNGLLNVDAGITGQHGFLTDVEVYGSGQDNTRNSSGNFAALYCYNAANPVLNCGAVNVDESGNASAVRSSNPPTNEQGGVYLNRGGYASGFNIPRNTGGGAVYLAASGSMLGSNVATASVGGNGDVGFVQLLSPPIIGSLASVGGGVYTGTRCYRLSAMDAHLGESAIGPESCITGLSSNNVSIPWTTSTGQQIYAIRVYYAAAASVPPALSEANYLKAASVTYTVAAGITNGTITDDGTYTNTAATPPTISNGFISRQSFDNGGYSWLAEDVSAINGGGTAGNYTGFGTTCEDTTFNTCATDHVRWDFLVNSVTSTWLRIQSRNIGTGSTTGLWLDNPTAATAGNQKYSPVNRFTGQGWKTTATAASQTVDYTQQLVPVQGAANPTFLFTEKGQVNGGGYSTLRTIDQTGNETITGNETATGNLSAAQVVSNDTGPFGGAITMTPQPCETAFAATTVNTGSATTTTGQTCVLANAFILDVTYRITTTITTAASFTVGISGSTSKFCSTQSTLTSGTTGHCVLQVNAGAAMSGASAVAVVVTFNTTPGAGAIRLEVASLAATAPTS